MPRDTQKYVLVIDDDPIIITAFIRAFAGQEENFLLNTANSLDQALRLIGLMVYDLIFLDMKLGPTASGMRILETLREQEIRAQAEGVPFLSTAVVIMSGSMSINSFSQQAHDLDVFHFIDKPVNFSPEFIRRVVNKFGLPLLPRRRGGDS